MSFLWETLPLPFQDELAQLNQQLRKVPYPFDSVSRMEIGSLPGRYYYKLWAWTQAPFVCEKKTT